MKRIGEIGIDINGNLVKILYEGGTIMEQNPIKDSLEMSMINLEGTLINYLNQAIERTFKAKIPLIKRRNRIIDNPLKLFLPYYKKRLARIDNQIDELDLSIYELEKNLRKLKVYQESIKTGKKTFNPFLLEPHTD